MFRFLLLIGFILLLSWKSPAQYHFGVGASLHFYDQVVGVKSIKHCSYGNIGLELGLGIERSLQGAMAPQIALFWRKSIQTHGSDTFAKGPFYAVRYQFDFQKASFLDTYHGVYLGLGYAFGPTACFDVQLSLGAVVERMYGVYQMNSQKLHFLLNPQLQLNYYLPNRSK